MRPKLLDLFCGAGGCAVGYHRAGFDVVGVDIKPQPRYPFAFVQMDAIEAVERISRNHWYIESSTDDRVWFGKDFAVIHASPPCQSFSRTRKIMEGKGIGNPRAVDFIEVSRGLLKKAGLPYVIENVPGCPLVKPIRLCGAMFGLRVLRHRIFESSMALDEPIHPKHNGTTNSHRGYSRGGQYVTVGGHNYNLEDGKKAMGIDWMKTRDGELNEAIPPAYTTYIGLQLMRMVRP